MIEAVESVAASSSGALAVFLGSNLILGAFMSFILTYLWGMINALQIVTLTTLFNLDIPDNANIIMEAILALMSLEVVDTDSLFVSWFGFRETQLFALRTLENGEELSKFEDAGYDSSNFIQLLGPIFLLMVVAVVIAPVKALLKCITKSASDNCFTRRVRKQMDY